MCNSSRLYGHQLRLLPFHLRENELLPIEQAHTGMDIGIKGRIIVYVAIEAVYFGQNGFLGHQQLQEAEMSLVRL